MRYQLFLSIPQIISPTTVGLKLIVCTDHIEISRKATGFSFPHPVHGMRTRSSIPQSCLYLDSRNHSAILTNPHRDTVGGLHHGGRHLRSARCRWPDHPLGFGYVEKSLVPRAPAVDHRLPAGDVVIIWRCSCTLLR